MGRVENIEFDQIKNILFDFGGVIISLSKRNAIAKFKEIGFLEIEQYLGEFRQKGIFLDYETGKLSPKEFYDSFRKIGNNAATNEQIDDAWKSFLIEIPQYKYELLKELRSKYNVLLLSNTNPSIERWMRSSEFSSTGETIDCFFNKCFMSFEMGVAKPDEEIYIKLIDESKIKPSETLFLDDGLENIEVAKKLGFQVYLANQDEDLRKVFDKIIKN